MERRMAVLVQVDNDHPITKETDPDFWYHLQNGLLLGLKELGILGQMQYRFAHERLRRQFNYRNIQKRL